MLTPFTLYCDDLVFKQFAFEPLAHLQLCFVRFYFTDINIVDISFQEPTWHLLQVLNFTFLPMLQVYLTLTY